MKFRCSDVLEPFIRGQRDFCCLGFHTIITTHHLFRCGIIEDSQVVTFRIQQVNCSITTFTHCL